VPRVKIFAGKAAASYRYAKLIISSSTTSPKSSTMIRPSANA